MRRTSSPMRTPKARARPGRSPCQNGILPGLAGRRGDEDALVRDLLRAPRRRAEEEHLALAQLEDHLLVELAHAATRRSAVARRAVKTP